ncbi:MAG: transposase [Terriglobales bacterium]
MNPHAYVRLSGSGADDPVEAAHTRNVYVESSHGQLREECSTLRWFQNLFNGRRKITAWKIEYNEDRPHSNLGNCTPKEFVAAQAAGIYETERSAGPFRHRVRICTCS